MKLLFPIQGNTFLLSQDLLCPLKKQALVYVHVHVSHTI